MGRPEHDETILRIVSALWVFAVLFVVLTLAVVLVAKATGWPLERGWLEALILLACAGVALRTLRGGRARSRPH